MSEALRPMRSERKPMGMPKNNPASEGRELIIKIMGPGDYFCCAPLCSGGNYMVRGIALEDSTLIVIPSQTFMTVLRNSVGETGWKIISGLCKRIHYLSGLLEDLAEELDPAGFAFDSLPASA